MEKFFKQENKRGFFFFLMLSCSIHIFSVVFFLSSNRLWDFFSQDKIIVPASIRVDMVALPDFPSKRETVKKKEKPAVLPVKEVKKKPEKTKKPEKIGDLKKKEVQKQQLQEPKEKKPPEERDTDDTQNEQEKPSDLEEKVNKGNQIVEGEEKGEEILNQQQMLEINTYMMSVKAQTEANWNLPKYLTDMNLTAQIEIRINNEGGMIYKQIVLSSGNELFDSYVLKAIENSAPYPPPPANVRDLIRSGIVLSLDSR